MREKGKTLPHSEQKALDAVFKLMKLGAIPDYPWFAANMGKVEEVERNGNLKIKRREAIFEWKTFPDLEDSDSKTVLQILLKGEIAVCDSGEEMPLQKRWWVERIEILSEGKEYRASDFALEERGNIHFLLNLAKS